MIFVLADFRYTELSNFYGQIINRRKEPHKTTHRDLLVAQVTYLLIDMIFVLADFRYTELSNFYGRL